MDKRRGITRTFLIADAQIEGILGTGQSVQPPPPPTATRTRVEKSPPGTFARLAALAGLVLAAVLIFQQGLADVMDALRVAGWAALGAITLVSACRSGGATPHHEGGSTATTLRSVFLMWSMPAEILTFTPGSAKAPGTCGFSTSSPASL